MLAFRSRNVGGASGDGCYTSLETLFGVSPVSEILGIHHVTAIASDPQRNVDFYTQVLGLRLVKRTVNFDAPGTYHLYYGDAEGAPSTLLTFFPWQGVPPGRQGSGLTTATAFSVPPESMGWW